MNKQRRKLKKKKQRSEKVRKKILAKRQALRENVRAERMLEQIRDESTPRVGQIIKVRRDGDDQ